MAHTSTGDLDIYYAFQGGMPTITGGLIASATNTPLSHVVLVVVVRSSFTLTICAGDIIDVPVGTYAFHATNHKYDNSIGPYKCGVVLTPLQDVYNSYLGGTWIWVYPVDPHQEGSIEDMKVFMAKHWGDPYGKYFMINPICIITGEFPEHNPVCTTLVGSWLRDVGYFERNEYEGPGGLLRKMLQSKYFTMSRPSMPRMPVDSIIVLSLLVGIILLVTWMRTWR